MRYALAEEMTDLAAEDDRLVLLSGDIGNNMWNDYKLTCPDRFVNCGVAEANMMSMAAGMALSGLRPVVYTITAFNTARCFEQIKIDVAYHEAPVVIVGTGSGLCYSKLGPTHHSLEDISLLRDLPGMTVFCPGDPLEVQGGIRAAIEHDGPVYFRLGRKGEPTYHKEKPEIVFGEPLTLRDGEDVCILNTGNTLDIAMEAAEKLEERHVSTKIVSHHTVKPLNEGFLERAFRDYGVVATLEEHSVAGGFGSAVAEWLADHPIDGARLERIGTPDKFLHEVGGPAHMRKKLGLSPAAVADRLTEALKR